VRRYLAEFLSDPRVVPLPRMLWIPILYGFVLNSRPKRSAKKYAAIWTPGGSPLAVHTARQTELLRTSLKEFRVEYAMRYGEPSVASGLEKLSGCESVNVVPLYPQYSDSATGTVLDLLPRTVSVSAVKDFHDHPAYIEALAANVRKHWQTHERSKMMIMSYHGLPKRGAELYEQQCLATSELLAKALDLQEGEWRATFQSRFGFAEWLQPYTQPTLEELGRNGLSRIDVVCPGFVSDCLETLEEIGITAKEAFLAAGGKELRLIPCLNELPEWIAALAEISTKPASK
jgi:protoporphyrin/coproporphyrin ferrochelatase